MTDSPDLDSSTPENRPLELILSEKDALNAGLRVTRAQFSRVMGVSKQAVTDWVKSGRVVLGTDGRLDPRQAVTQLLRTGDPARLRARVLEPLVKEVAAAQKNLDAVTADAKRRLAAMASELASAREEADFYEGAAEELLLVQKAILIRLAEAWDTLRTMEQPEFAHRLSNWLEEASQVGKDPGFSLTDPSLSPVAALGDEKKGGRDCTPQGDEDDAAPV